MRLVRSRGWVRKGLECEAEEEFRPSLRHWRPLQGVGFCSGERTQVLHVGRLEGEHRRQEYQCIAFPGTTQGAECYSRGRGSLGNEAKPYLIQEH